MNPASVEWECSDCGRTHPKNSPPCSRCGNMQLESVEANQFDEEELSSGLGIFDVAKFVGALAVIAVLLFATVNAGLLGQNQAPTVENVPGEENESNGLDLSTVEYQIYESINEERPDTVALEPDMTRISEYYNKLMVKRSEYPLDTSSESVFEQFNSCSNPSLAYNRIGYNTTTDERAIEQYASEEKLAQALVDSWLTDAGTRPILLAEAASVGLDVHIAENGDIYATVTFC